MTAVITESIAGPAAVAVGGAIVRIRETAGIATGRGGVGRRAAAIDIVADAACGDTHGCIAMGGDIRAADVVPALPVRWVRTGVRVATCR